jgi:hypothetical protein
MKSRIRNTTPEEKFRTQLNNDFAPPEPKTQIPNIVRAMCSGAFRGLAGGAMISFAAEIGALASGGDPQKIKYVPNLIAGVASGALFGALLPFPQQNQ